MSYLLDTNIISELVRLKPNSKVIKWFSNIPNQALFISVLTLGEIRKGIEKISNPERKEKLRIWLEHDLTLWFENRVLTIDHQVADKWGRLENAVKRNIPVIDGLLAATALHHDLSLVTRNTQDFNFPNLEVINPFL